MTLKVILRTTHKKKDGTCPISFRIQEPGKSYPRIVGSGFSVLPSQFKDGKVVKHNDAVLINAEIERLRSEHFKSMIDHNAGAVEVKEPTMGEAITRLLDHYEAAEKVAAFNRMTTNRRLLLECWGSLDKPLSKITKADVDTYIDHRHRLKNSGSTIKKNLMDLAVVLNYSGHPGPNPFKAASATVKAVPVKRSKLTQEEMDRLEAAPLVGIYAIARDMFFFAYYAHGMRFESAATITRDMVKGASLTYRMNKGQKIREIEIHPKLRTIIDRYATGSTPFLFPVIKVAKWGKWERKKIVGGASSLIRNYLKGAAIQAGIEVHISMHVSRHTFAYRALQNNVPHGVIKDALGQTNFATTEGYLKSLSDDRINNALRDMW